MFGLRARSTFLRTLRDTNTRTALGERFFVDIRCIRPVQDRVGHTWCRPLAEKRRFEWSGVIKIAVFGCVSPNQISTVLWDCFALETPSFRLKTGCTKSGWKVGNGPQSLDQGILISGVGCGRCVRSWQRSQGKLEQGTPAGAL